MLWPSTDLDSVYANIRENALKVGCSVLIIVASDCDALCACSILVRLLRSDNVRYSVQPVEDPAQLEDAFDNLISSAEETDFEEPEIKSLVFLNCGGEIDIIKKFEGLASDRFFYIVDCRRPFHPNNVSASNSQVIVLGDIGDNLESINNKEVALIGKKRPRSESSLSDTQHSSNKENTETPNHDQDSSVFGTNEKKLEQVVEEEITQKTEMSRVSENLEEDEYFSCTSIGQPTSHTLFVLSRQLNKADSECLWLAAVGSTHHLTRQNLPKEDYLVLLSDYVSLNSSLPNATDTEGIEANVEHDLFLHRHIPLYTSLVLTEKVCCKFGVGRRLGDKTFNAHAHEDGEQWNFKVEGTPKLNIFLARMGVAIEQCKESSAPSFKQKFLTSLERNDGIEDLQYHSFTKRIGFGELFSAADAVLSVNALLTTNEDFSTTQAMEALDDPDILYKGFDEAVEIRRVICCVSSRAIRKKLIKSAGDFRYLMLSNLLPEEEKVLRNAENLFRLGVFLMSLNTANERWTGLSFKPLVLAAEFEERDYLQKEERIIFVAIENNYEAVLKKRLYRSSFEVAAEQVKADFLIPRFDLACVEMDARFKLKFLAALHDVVTDLPTDV